MFVPWPEIESYQHILKSIEVYPPMANLVPSGGIVYRAKIKLHGTNSAVRVNSDGNIFYQSRSQNITSTNDPFGFARWAETIQWPVCDSDYVLFGEWFGRGINKGAAACMVPKKHFAIFGLYFPKDNTLLSEPSTIRLYLSCTAPEFWNHDNIYIIPWYWGDEKQLVDILGREDSERFVNMVNDHVATVKKCDPWIKQEFGVEGIGEGLVFYPVNMGNQLTDISRFMFKAKGEQHRVTKTNKAAELSIVTPETIEQFINMFVTPARLQQGIDTVCQGQPTMRDIGKFIQWFQADVQKESKLELAESGLEWKSIAQPLTSAARKWYLENQKQFP